MRQRPSRVHAALSQGSPIAAEMHDQQQRRGVRELEQ
jgi:hypothetical protein